jgi:hypothetical protein
MLMYYHQLALDQGALETTLQSSEESIVHYYSRSSAPKPLSKKSGSGPNKVCCPPLLST